MNEKRKRVPKVLFSVIVLIVIVAGANYMGFASTRSGLRVGYVGTETRGGWTGRYALLDGTMEKQLYADGTLSVTVETREGSIAMEITDRDGNVLYHGEDMGTASFQLEASGRVTVRVTAQRHKGSFALEAAS